MAAQRGLGSARVGPEVGQGGGGEEGAAEVAASSLVRRRGEERERVVSGGREEEERESEREVGSVGDRRQSRGSGMATKILRELIWGGRK